MRYRRSLRVRIIFSYLAVGGLIAPLLAVFLFAAIYQLEEQIIGQHVEVELQYLIELTRNDPTLKEQHSRRLQTSVRAIGEPPATDLIFVAHLQPGKYEVEYDGITYFVLIVDQNKQRYTVVYDITEFEEGELYLMLVLAGGTLSSLGIAVWFGYWLSRRLIAPVTSLAHQVSALRPEQLAHPLADDYPHDEVGELACAFDAYNQRLYTFIQRERDFTADASHELRNPLAVIQNAAELLLERDELSATVRTRLERIERASRDMNDSLSALLILARENAPAGAALEDKTDVATVVEATLKNQGLPLARPDVRAETVLSARPSVVAPANVVTVLIGNLIRNAFSYTYRGHILICLDERRLAIEDTGVGIAEADLNHVFERGFRGVGAPGAGSGLGLSIARRICERYGWTLQIRSDQGSGTQVEWIFRPS